MPAELGVDRIALDREDGTYAPGEEATFAIHMKETSDEVQICLSNDGYKIHLQHPLQLRHGKATITGRLDQPGFLRCRVDAGRAGQATTLLACASYDPHAIQPTTTEPDDFDAFWEDQKKQLAEIPAAAQLELICSEDKCDLYKISLDHIDGARVYGYLGRPAQIAGPWPALLTLQNHGGGAWSVPPAWAADFARRGFLSMAINTHDVENGMDDAYYTRLNRGPLASYTLRGFMDRDTYYFKAVFLRLVRAIDYLTDHAEWDGKSMILTGRSQGGGLSLVGAGLDRRVSGIVCAVPALCEHGGHKFGRPASWPRFVANDEHDYGNDPNAETINGHGPVSETVWQVSRYYDAVNFARKIKCPAVLCLGLLDTCVPPTTVFSAYNVLQGPKEIVISPNLGHGADRNPAYRRDERICELASRAGSRVNYGTY